MNVLAIVVLLFAAALPGEAQEGDPRVEYEASFENAVHHEARISVTYRAIGSAPLELRMARSSPGRYAIHEFAKNVYDVSAVDGAGKPLKVSRVDPYSWRFAGHDGTVKATYTLFADRADGTYSQIDETHAHLNMPATFMWARGFDRRPIKVTFRTGERSWKVATQLPPADEAMTFHAPDLQYFMDSPTELSDFAIREWRLGDQTVRLAAHHAGIEEDMDQYVERAKKVIDQHVQVFGEAPKFDFGVYTFIADYLPQVSGDGMEHRNSTVISESEGLYEADFEQLGTLSHEFFHAWNVERLRPVELEPFDFTRANPTPSLWFAEGFTSYYGPLLVRRAGESSIKEHLEGLSGLLNTVVRGTGRRFASPQEMSLRAPFVDAATAIDPTNFANTFVSYYPYGATVALALDLTLRQKFEHVTLDNFMRRLWLTHGKTEKPYTPQDLVQGLAFVTGDAKFAAEFFARSVEGSELPEFGPLLEAAGLKLRLKNAGKASFGRVAWQRDGKSVIIRGAVQIGEPLYLAGLDRGDEILALGRFAIDDEEDVRKALRRHQPGDKMTVRFLRRGQERVVEAVLDEDATLEIVRLENADGAPSDSQLAFRSAWLGSDTPKDPKN
ncbi:MAG: M61 family metallopeptidase [Vicinamibacteria bacterium]|nr:M61 family metallopeptidase [Vicinamibacteria bacterium]